ncbi:putative methyltransferase [Apostichopus japonicus]|uniref:Putative methyltransferase n=1 Tax=Stichopus japonicus TaxID=307972 RepID=A0A2G8LQI6_STIJA|nr:putative methyltransferase [Apostichopus japonicus]
MTSGAGPRLFEAASHAKLYSKFRPTYPKSVIQKILSFLLEKHSAPLELAVDIGCGSGQSSRSLTPHFKQVVGLDVSQVQISQAQSKSVEENLTYRQGSAEEIPFSDHSIDLITCAQSLHWFNADKFYKEASRTLKHQGCVAVYGYGVNLPYVPDEGIQTSMHQEYLKIYKDILGPHWDKRRYHVDNLYCNIQVPFRESKRDDSVVMEAVMSVDDMIGYIKTWSSYQTYIRMFPEKSDFLLKHRQKFLEIIQPISPSTPAEEIRFDVRGPIFILLGRNSVRP